MRNKINILKYSNASGNRNASRQVRKNAMEALIKEAQTEQAGVFQVFRDGIIEYKTRQNSQGYRGGDLDYKEYNLSEPGPKSDHSLDVPSRTLSTRYSPDRPGVQARRISDGVYQDPITNRIYDYNSGFKTESGDDIAGGHVSLQTDFDKR
jgi:hypothetical protein